MRTAEDFAKEYYQLDKSGIESVRMKSAIQFAKRYAIEVLQSADEKIAFLDWGVMDNDVDGQECLKAIRSLINELK